MATRHHENPRQTLLEEAADPETDPERLRHLAKHAAKAVERVVIQNPVVPEDVWRKALLEGDPEAWSNPMAPIYLLVWSPQPGDWRTIEDGARRAAIYLWENPDRCSPDGKVLINCKILEWWAYSVSALHMIEYIQSWASAKGTESEEHKALVRLLVLCVRTVPNLTAEDRQALDLLDAWCAGGEDRSREAQALASLNVVLLTVLAAINPSGSHISWGVIYDVLESVAVGKEWNESKKAKAEHDRLLADLIRKEMPLPPLVE